MNAPNDMNKMDPKRPALAAAQASPATGGASVVFDNMMLALAAELTKDVRKDVQQARAEINQIKRALREKATKEGDHDLANDPALRDSAPVNAPRDSNDKPLHA